MEALDKKMEFSLKGDDNKIYTQDDFKGKKLLMYFYPKDDTPGCSLEALDFDNLSDEFKKFNITIAGVSKDSIESHCNFKEKKGFDLLLLSDPELALHKKLGTWGEKMLYGVLRFSVIRSTFLMDEEGNIIKEWKNVRAKGHAERVLKYVKSNFGE